MLIDWFTVAAQATNFLILVWLLKRFLYKPILAAIAGREQKIATELQAAAAAKAQAEKERDELRLQNDALRGQRSEMLRKATDEANAERQQLMTAARKDSQDLRSKLSDAVTNARAQLNREILTGACREVFALTRKILTDLSGATLEDRTVEVFIRRLHEMSDVQKATVRGSSRATAETPLPAPMAVVPAMLRSAFELTPTQHTAIESAVREWLVPGVKLSFEISPELINGIELCLDGRIIAWNVTDYLASLSTNISALLDAAADAGSVTAPSVTTAPIPPAAVQHAA